MSDEKLPQPLEDEHANSAPKGAEVVLMPSSPVAADGCNEAQLFERVEKVARHVAVTTVKHEMHAGPMPSPKQFGEYDSILPGTALAIRDEFQANGRHIRDMESQGQGAVIESDKQNRQTAERLVWASLGLILLLSLTGHENVAIAVSVTTVAAVITGFLSKKHPQKPDDQADTEE